MSVAPRLMDPAAAAEVLRHSLKEPKRPMTVADASVTSGLPLRDAEAGLHWLTSEYRGHLRVTEDGDLVHVFPDGFTKPWETKDSLAKIFATAGRGLLGVGRFVVRAWILVVMVGYAALFLALLIGMTFTRGSNDRNSNSGLGFVGVILRVLADAMFWTFHPFSPVYVGGSSFAQPSRMRRGPRAAGDRETPFYEKVNRFVFGPTAAEEDPHAMRARVLAEIRDKRGRIGLADVMRVTGLPRDEADPLMARLMLDHDGTVEVAEQGGIVYRFEALRRTAEMASLPGGAPRAAWESPKKLAPLTGNGIGANLGVAALNGFNLLASLLVLANGLTVANIMLLFSKHPPAILPDDGTPWVLGLIPALFSAALFLLPVARAAFRRRAAGKIARENARLAILREVLARAPKKQPVPDDVLRQAYRVATGIEPSSKEITRRVVDLGGDVDVGPEGEVRYRFADLEAEAEALEEERAHATEGEARLGKVVFASDDA